MPDHRPVLRLSLVGRNGEVPERSGLNWWNAGGRVRNENEVYIALPAEALPQAEVVFGSANTNTTFLARMHDGRRMRMRLEGQQGADRSKAKQVTSDLAKPILGEWMLRQVLGIAPGVIVTRADLDRYGRTDITFTRNGQDAHTGEALVEVDFAPPGALDHPTLADRLLATSADDVVAMYAEESATVYEGTKTLVFTNQYERSPELRARAIVIHGTRCAVCGLDFRELYGEWGEDYIEVHHLRPISMLGGPTAVDPETDMTVLCANCHRMVHRKRERVLTPEELRELLAGRRLKVFAIDEEA